MENQHKKISGYRDLTQQEIDLMNLIKHQGVELKGVHDKVADHITRDASRSPNERRRWLSIARTHYQQALMAMTRAVADPDFE